jgi:hypothetical protein
MLLVDEVNENSERRLSGAVRAAQGMDQERKQVMKIVAMLLSKFQPGGQCHPQFDIVYLVARKATYYQWPTENLKLFFIRPGSVHSLFRTTIRSGTPPQGENKVPLRQN